MRAPDHIEFKIEPLHSSHNREDFACGLEDLDRYLQERIDDDVSRSLIAPFVLIDVELYKIMGYYTLSGSSIPVDDLPRGLSKKFPKYKRGLPISLIGRLAVDISYQRLSWGETLLMDALYRCLHSTMPSIAVVVDAFEDAVGFYQRYGFKILSNQQSPESSTQPLFLPMKQIKAMFTD